MKKPLAILLIASLLLGITPAYAATSSTVSVEAFAQRLLTQMGQPSADPFEKALELKMIPANDPMLNAKSKPVTKEQTAQLIYGALRVTENLKPDLYYERLLSSFVDDYKSIDKTYQRAVCNAIMQGFYEPTSTKPNAMDKLFLPKKTETEADVQLLLSRFSNKSLRYDPFQYNEYISKRDKIKTWQTNKRVVSNSVFPKVSPYKSKVPFLNGRPNPNREAVIKSLYEGEYNHYSMGFKPYYKYEEYLAICDDDMKLHQEHFYEVATKFMDTFYNYNYKDMVSQEKSLKPLMPSVPEAYELISDQKIFAEKYKVSMESFYVTDKTLFYDGTQIRATKCKVYFRLNGDNKTVPFRFYNDYKSYDEKLKTNTWYAMEVEIRTEIVGNDAGKDWCWEGDYMGVVQVYNISDIYELTPQ